MQHRGAETQHPQKKEDWVYKFDSTHDKLIIIIVIMWKKDTQLPDCIKAQFKTVILCFQLFGLAQLLKINRVTVGIKRLLHKINNQIYCMFTFKI